MRSGKRGTGKRMNNEMVSCNKICGRLCFELKGNLASGLSVGSGEQEETDMDVILDSKGIPFVPGSALAGVLREYTENIVGREEAAWLFGTPKNGIIGAENDRQSRIFVYDMIIEEAQIGIRDGIRLGEEKTPEFQSKYEIQMIERNAAFKIRLEIIQRQLLLKKYDISDQWEKDIELVRKWAQGFSSGELTLGAKRNRGFGRLRIDQIRIKKFHMEEKKSYLEWLDWDWNKPDAFNEAVCRESKEIQRYGHCLEVPLYIPYTLLIRTYSTAFAKADELPDYEQLTVGTMGEQAVIPGSSIAGAFRGHIAKIVKEIGHLKSWEDAQQKLEPFFGTWVGNDEEKIKNHSRNGKHNKLRASRIIFEETLVDGGHGFPVYRNAIDRFTQGTVDGALYEAVPWAGGNVLFRVRWTTPKSGEAAPDYDSIVCGMLLWAILDLQAGILPIGGETAVGRGIFSSPEGGCGDIIFDGDKLDTPKKEQYMQCAAHWAREVGDGSADR